MEFITVNKSQALGEKEKESCDKPHPWCKWSQKGQSTSFCLTIHLEKIKTQQENYQKSSFGYLFNIYQTTSTCHEKA
jgi:hypothetical protein